MRFKSVDVTKFSLMLLFEMLYELLVYMRMLDFYFFGVELVCIGNVMVMFRLMLF